MQAWLLSNPLESERNFSIFKCCSRGFKEDFQMFFKRIRERINAFLMKQTGKRTRGKPQG